MILLKDGGHGITEESLRFWHLNKDKLGLIILLEASFEPLGIDMDDLGVLEYNVVIHGYNGDMFLSGCNCGYGGTGPNGTAKILAELGVPIETARQAMWHKKVEFDVLSSRLTVDGEVFDFPLAKQRREEWAKFIDNQS
jgi:hypothetical protein